MGGAAGGFRGVAVEFDLVSERTNVSDGVGRMQHCSWKGCAKLCAALWQAPWKEGEGICAQVGGVATRKKTE